MIKNKNIFVATLSIVMAMCLVSVENANAAARVAVHGTPAAGRKSVAAATSNIVAVIKETKEAEPVAEDFVIVNKSSEFSAAVSDVLDSATEDNSFAEQIRKQRAALAASDALTIAANAQRESMANNSNTCDRALRKCMSEKCGNDFTKCALDGDTIFGDKLNACRRDTTCTSTEFNLFVPEIKADRDMNVRLASYENIISCGNQYNACIVNACGTTYNKCLGKTAADAAIQKCATIAKECAESDSGLANRFGTSIGLLRNNAEVEIRADEERMYKLRDLMSESCKKLGAMFDERTFDCIYTVNFFAGDNQTNPTASRKRYAGDSFICMQEWFGINATTFKENAYRETRSQTAASSAMLGSGVGSAVGLITSGAINRALDTQKAKKELKDECKSQGMVMKDGKCVADDKAAACSSKSGEYKAGSCWCGSVIMTKNSTCENGKIKYTDKDGNNALKRKGMVCTAEYNKTHDTKVALATYNDNGKCEAGGQTAKPVATTAQAATSPAATSAATAPVQESQQQTETPAQKQARIQKENEQNKKECESKGKSYTYTVNGCVQDQNKKQIYDEIEKMKKIFVVEPGTKWKPMSWVETLARSGSAEYNDYYQEYIRLYNACFAKSQQGYKVSTNNFTETCIIER